MHRRESNEAPEWEHWSPLTPKKEQRNRGGAASKVSSLQETDMLVARMIMRVVLRESGIIKLPEALGRPASRHDTADRGATATIMYSTLSYGRHCRQWTERTATGNPFSFLGITRRYTLPRTSRSSRSTAEAWPRRACKRVSDE